MNPELAHKIIQQLQADIPLVARPYADIAQRVGCSEEEVISLLADYRQRGVIRRMGAVLNHYNLGFNANGMGIWRVKSEDVDRVGAIMAAFPEVTHCYERPTAPDWIYNMYTMIHGHTQAECEEVACRISQATGITDYKVLFSSREFKKVSMTYY